MENIEYFLQILKDFIWEKESLDLKYVDWEHMKKDAHRHQVEAIFYKQTHKAEFQKAFATQAYFSINRNRLVDELRIALKDFEFVFVKGLEIAKYYPYPELRTMGDSDLLVHFDDKVAIHKIFIQLGYSFEDYHEEEAKYIKNNLEIEMHDKLLHVLDDDKDSVLFFDQVWHYVHNGELDWNFHMIYLLKHLSRHLLSGGAGFRQFMDIAILTQKLTLDWNWIEHELEKIKLLKFSKRVFELNNIWFEIKPPMEVDELDPMFVKDATKRIYECGVFGQTSKDKDIVSIANKAKDGNNPLWVVKASYMLTHLFPSYSTMMKNEFCQYLRTKKLLLPVAWVHRWIRYSTNEKKRKTLQKKLCSSYKDIKQRNDYLSSWGL